MRFPRVSEPYWPYRKFVLAASIVVALGLAGLGAHPAAGQSLNGSVLFAADDISYDGETGLVNASGSVEVTAGERILMADRVTYDERTDTVTAQGNVSVLEADGSVYFADTIELTDQLKNGFIEGFRGLLTDNSRFAAARAQRTDGNRTEMERAVYSPCPICDDEPHRPPLWRIRASKIVHDQEKQSIEYRNARLELFGVPVAYTPFFSHPDPTVDRKSGFLVPTYRQTSQLGTTVEVPYFFNLAPNRDVTFQPLFTTREGIVADAEYRQRTNAGQFQLRGTVTRVDERDDENVKTGDKKVRSHIEGNGKFDIDDTWRWGFDAARSSDDTYLRRYGFSSADSLTANVFVEGIDGRSYAAANIYSFQGLRAEDDPGQTPLVLPALDYNLVSEPGRFGETYELDANLLVLTRNEGTDSRRVSLHGAVSLPRTGPFGQIINISADLRADGYWVSDVPDPLNPGASNRDGLTGRIVPQVTVDWRWPLVRAEHGARQVIEPVASFVLSPYGGNPNDIPNEDSINFEFDDTNVFASNRFPGLDRIEGGPRINYGFRYGLYGNNGGSLTALIGQSIRGHEDDTFAARTGLETRRSDYVGRIDLSPSPLFTLYQRFRLDRDNLALQRNEISFSTTTDRFGADITYVRLSRELTADEITGREEINLRAHAQLAANWLANARTRRDLGDDGGTINAGAGLVYEDVCFNVAIDFNRNFTRDRDVQPTSSVTFRVRLKHLG